MSDDYRSAVEAAFNQAESTGGDDGSGSAQGAAEPVAVESPGVETAAPVGSESAPGVDGGSQQTKAERARDDSGRFATKSKTKEVAKPAAGSPVAEGPTADVPPTAAAGAQLPEVAAAPAQKAPQGLTPAEREAFATATPEIQKALQRLDQTSRQAMQESAPARQLANAFQETVSPYVGMMRAAGAQNPLQAVGGILQQWAVLQGGNVESKAQLVASLVRQSGIPIELLAQAIDGSPQQQQGQPQHFDPVAIRQQIKQELMQDFQGQRQQAESARAQQEAQAFLADPKNKYAEDLRDEMAALLSSGRKLSLQEAYDRACWSDPEIRDILIKRKEAEVAKASTASTQQARIAASSVKSTPSTGASSIRAPKTVAEAVRAAFDQVDGL